MLWMRKVSGEDVRSAFLWLRARKKIPSSSEKTTLKLNYHEFGGGI